MAETRWTWDPDTKRYRDRETGQFLAARRVHALRDQYVEYRTTQMRRFVEGAVEGVDRTNGVEWRAAVRRVEQGGWRRIENTLITEYVYGRGGVNAMTDADKSILRSMLRQQKTYWSGFMREALDDPEKMTTAYMANRANLYHHGSTGFFERAKARSWEVVLPAYPGDGGTPCLSRCKCHWELVATDEGVEATWVATGHPCPGCEENAQAWSPLLIAVNDEEGVYT